MPRPSWAGIVGRQWTAGRSLPGCASWPGSCGADGWLRRPAARPDRRPTRSARRCSTPSPASTSSSTHASPTSTPAAGRSASRRCRAVPRTARSSSATAAPSRRSTENIATLRLGDRSRVIVGDGIATAPQLDVDLAVRRSAVRVRRLAAAPARGARRSRRRRGGPGGRQRRRTGSRDGSSATAGHG